MRIRVLGSSAGGGLPQWNCRCPNCAAARAGSPDVDPRTQSSVAVSADGDAWFLLNASPDVRRQILDFPELTPAGEGPRATSIAGVVLTDAEIDHASGLLLLREGCRFGVYSSPLARRFLEADFPVARVVSSFADRPWAELPAGEFVDLPLPAGGPSGLRIRAFEVDPHVPKYVADPPAAIGGSVVGLEIEDERTGRILLYAPCLASAHPDFAEAFPRADVVLLDGTFWSDDEPRRAGFSERTALDMGHWPVGDPGGSLAWLTANAARAKAGARIAYIHMNNTNPMLRRGSEEAARVREAGIGITRDGDEFGG